PFARLEGVESEDGAVQDDELPRIEHRCRLKAEACRWALERRDLLAAGAEFALEIRPRDDHQIARAKAVPDCFLWMAGKVEPQADNREDWEQLEAAFEVLADAVAVLRAVIPFREEERDIYRALVELLAECQSAL